MDQKTTIDFFFPDVFTCIFSFLQWRKLRPVGAPMLLFSRKGPCVCRIGVEVPFRRSAAAGSPSYVRDQTVAEPCDRRFSTDGPNPSVPSPHLRPTPVCRLIPSPRPRPHHLRPLGQWLETYDQKLIKIVSVNHQKYRSNIKTIDPARGSSRPWLLHWGYFYCFVSDV